MADAPLKFKFQQGLTENDGVVSPNYATSASTITSSGTGTPGAVDKFARADHVHPTNFLRDKSGLVRPFEFSGNPKRATVLFTAPFPDARYSVTISSSEGRTWLVENQSSSGFEINSQANTGFVGTVYWQAKQNGESQ